jgi:hypothetical protein
MQAGDPRALSRAVFVYPAQNDADEGLEPFVPPANRSSCDGRRGIATLWGFFWLLSSTQQSHRILSVGVVVNENVTCPNRTGPASTDTAANSVELQRGILDGTAAVDEYVQFT